MDLIPKATGRSPSQRDGVKVGLGLFKPLLTESTLEDSAAGEGGFDRP